MEPEELLWGMLIGAFLVSTIHLVTMFATRWGERRVTGKALLCSLMLHFAFAVGIMTVAPVPGIPQGGGTDQEEHRVVIRGVSTEPEARAPEPDAAQTPVWDRVPAAKNVTKATGPVPQLPEMSAPDVHRVEQKTKPNDVKPPDLASLPDTLQPPPAPTHEEPAPSKQAAQTPEIEIPTSNSPTRADPAPPSIGTHTPSTDSKTNPAVARQPSELGTNSPTASKAAVANPTLVASIAAPDARQAVVSETVPDSSLGGKPAPAPGPALPAEPATSRGPALAGPGTAAGMGSGSGLAKPTIGGPITPSNPEVGWQATVDRIRTNDLGANAGQPGSPAAGTNSEYQPLDTRPTAPAPQVQGTSTSPLIVRRSNGVPPTYRLRKLSNRKENARAFGGTDQSERAVEASLRWLAKVQEREGYWSAKAFGAGQVKIDENGVDRNYAGRDAESGVTALAILAFLGAGYTHEEGQYAENVDRALHWLVGQQRSDGNLGSGAGHFAAMYCHGMATYAIAEAYGMQNDPTSNSMLREPLVRAVHFILQNQNPDGGWRYVKGQKSDVSMFGWQLMALKSAEIAGVSIPRDAKVGMIGFLRERGLGQYGGLAGYREDLPASPSMTAEALFCKQMLGMKRNNAASQEAAEFLLNRLPRRSDYNDYYWYYGTLAMYQFGGTAWQTWNSSVREILVLEQRTGGELAGSWDPIGPWGRYGGRVYSTALSTLCLEVYYRFLPLYQMGTSRTD